MPKENIVLPDRRGNSEYKQKYKITERYERI